MIITYETQEEAEEANHEEAIARGCAGVTKFWWPMLENEDGTWSLVVDEPPAPEPPGEGEPI
jgi:hypothetical protein